MARAAARGVPRRWGGISGAEGRVLARGPRRPCGSRRHPASARRGAPRREPAVARGGDGVPVRQGPAGGGGGRHRVQRVPAALGRAMAARGEAQ